MKDFIEEERSIIDRLYENDKMEMLYVLWLIKNYDFPYIKNGEELKDDNLESEEKVCNTVHIMYEVFNTDKSMRVNNSVESYTEFIYKFADEQIYDISSDKFTEKYKNFWSVSAENIKEATEVKLQECRNNSIRMFIDYICDCLMFDRGVPNKGKLYWDVAEKLIDDIENNTLYDIKESVQYWSLLCNTAGSYEDVKGTFDHEEKKVLQALIYIERALNIRDILFRKKDTIGYFESEAYAVDLNNIGYTLIALEGNKYTRSKYGSYESIIRRIYDEIRPFLKDTSKKLWKALVISNFGAVEGKYGNHIGAVRYDLEALALKESIIRDEEEKKLSVSKDLLLTTVKSHINIVENSLMAIFESQLIYKNKNYDNIPIEKLNEYISLIGIHSIEAAKLRIDVDRRTLLRNSDEGYPDKKFCSIHLKRAIKRLLLFIDKEYRNIRKQNSIKNNSYLICLFKSWVYISGIDKQMENLLTDYVYEKVTVTEKDIIVKTTRY